MVNLTKLELFLLNIFSYPTSVLHSSYVSLSQCLDEKKGTALLPGRVFAKAAGSCSTSWTVVAACREHTVGLTCPRL
jgi:hypothetical protein